MAIRSTRSFVARDPSRSARALLPSVRLALPLLPQSEDFRWQTVPNGLNSSVEAVASYGGSVLVGGFFTTAGGVPITAIARHDGTGFIALDGGVGGGRGGPGGDVLELAPY